MMAKQKLTNAGRVWNRACYREDVDRREGDRALAAVLLVNGYIMNGGVGHAFDLEAGELAEGIAGMAYFGLHDLVAIIKPHGGEEEQEYNARYNALEGPGGGDRIRKAFEEMYRREPERFAPVGAE